ncbi:MAG: PhnD/SsuA/transferrin family substrate-binding protein [Pseudomonadota bacterium]
MIASLCWYPAARPAWDRLWTGLRARLGWGPDHLTWPHEFGRHWRDPDLVLSMTCALPMRLGLTGDVTLVGSPVWDLPGLPPGHYASHLVQRADDTRSVEKAAAAGLAINADDSQSGHGALRDAGLHGPRIVTGSHAASMAAVAGGQAHLAAIDAVTWALSPHPGLRIARTTPPTPSTPFITARPEWRAPVRVALADAIRAMPPEDRTATKLIGVVDLPGTPYAADLARTA